MGSNQFGVLHFGLRRAARNALNDSPAFTVTESAADADLVVVDACAFDGSDPVAAMEQQPGAAELPRVVLSLPSASEAAPGTYPARVATREAEALSDATRWCVLRCAAFGQELAWSWRNETAGVLYATWDPSGAPWVDADDLGSLLAVLMNAPDQWDAAYDITGPEVVSMADACEALVGLHNRTPRYVAMDEDTHRAVLEGAGFGTAFAARQVSYMAWTTSERCRTVSPVLEQALGRPPRGLERYFADALRSNPG